MDSLNSNITFTPSPLRGAPASRTESAPTPPAETRQEPTDRVTLGDHDPHPSVNLKKLLEMVSPDYTPPEGYQRKSTREIYQTLRSLGGH